MSLIFNFPVNKQDPEQGKILLSEPFLGDRFFKRSVVLLGEHNDKGTIGFILNKPTNIKISEAIEDFPEFNAPIYFGGPVQPESLFYIHSLNGKLDGSKEICKGVFWGGDFDELKFLIETKQVSPFEVKFFIGYSGWEPTQLDQELKLNSWIISNAKKDYAFSNHPTDLWADILKNMGTQYAMMANFPEDPAFN